MDSTLGGVSGGNSTWGPVKKESSDETGFKECVQSQAGRREATVGPSACRREFVPCQNNNHAAAQCPTAGSAACHHTFSPLACGLNTCRSAADMSMPVAAPMVQCCRSQYLRLLRRQQRSDALQCPGRDLTLLLLLCAAGAAQCVTSRGCAARHTSLTHCALRSSRMLLAVCQRRKCGHWPQCELANGERVSFAANVCQQHAWR